MHSQYERGSLGHMFDALRDWGIPEIIAGDVWVGKDTSVIMYRGKEFARYKYFEGIELPLFYFQDDTYRQLGQTLVIQEDGSVKPAFRLTLSPHGTPGLTITGLTASQELHTFIRQEALSSWIDSPGYKLMKDSGAFFQGGSENPLGEFIYIEFWIPKGAQAFVDFVNEKYRLNTKKEQPHEPADL